MCIVMNTRIMVAIKPYCSLQFITTNCWNLFSKTTSNSSKIAYDLNGSHSIEIAIIVKSIQETFSPPPPTLNNKENHVFVRVAHVCSFFFFMTRRAMGYQRDPFKISFGSKSLYLLALPLSLAKFFSSFLLDCRIDQGDVACNSLLEASHSWCTNIMKYAIKNIFTGP